MKLSESIDLLNSLGMIDWMVSNPEKPTQVIVNSIARHFFEERTPLDFRPFIESEYVYDYFLAHDWEIDWYSILSRDFVERVEVEIGSIALNLNDHDPMMSAEDFEKCVIDWVHEWRQEVKSRLADEINNKA